MGKRTGRHTTCHLAPNVGSGTSGVTSSRGSSLGQGVAAEGLWQQNEMRPD